jgi:glycosyltransferase involved in cell wall biosynthesis
VRIGSRARVADPAARGEDEPESRFGVAAATDGVEGSMNTRICFIGLFNLPVLAPEYNQHGIGGEEVQHTLLARALSARGFEASMVVLDYGQKDGESWDGVKTYKTHTSTAGFPGLRFFHPRWTGIWSAMSRADAEVYYVSCAGFPVGLAAMFARWKRRKTIFRIASDSDCEPERLLIEQNYRRDRWLYEFGLRRVDGILAQSAHQRAAMQRNYHLNSSVAPMLVDHPRTVFEFDQRSISVRWVSNIRMLKRPDTLLDLASELPDTMMHMIGGPIVGSTDLYEEIKTRAASQENVTFHGRIPYHDVNDYFAAARVFVNTSDIEGFPNSYLQAWARGTPVVAFFDPDRIIEREGLGVAVKDIAEMREAVRTLVSDRDRWHAASARCLAYMQRAFSDDKCIAPYLEVIGRLTGRGALP